MQYVPLWTCILKSRKVGSLSPELFRFWILCLVSAQEHDHRKGTLPSLDDLAYSLHMRMDEVEALMSQLVTRDFVADCDGVYTIHDWNDWKHVPDPTAAERKRRQRTKHAQPEWPARATAVTGVTETHDVTAVTNVTSGAKGHDVTAYQSRSEQSGSETPLPPNGDGRVWQSALPSELQPPRENAGLDRVARLAAELSGDVTWSIWVSAQARLGHPPHAIEQALDVCVNNGKWSRNLAAGVLRRLASEGYPEPQKPGGKAAAGEYRSQAKAYKIIPGP